VSMVRCPKCSAFVDTDEDMGFYGPSISECPEACESCRDDHSIDREEEYAAVCSKGGTHDWKAGTDWYGDPNVVHGTQTFPTWTCRKCGEYVTEEPAAYVEEEPPEMD